MFHHHQWVETRRVYNPPRTTSENIKSYDSELVLGFLYGFTNVSYQCSTCGEIKVFRIIGRVGE